MATICMTCRRRRTISSSSRSRTFRPARRAAIAIRRGAATCARCHTNACRTPSSTACRVSIAALRAGPRTIAVRRAARAAGDLCRARSAARASGRHAPSGAGSERAARPRGAVQHADVGQRRHADARNRAWRAGALRRRVSRHAARGGMGRGRAPRCDRVFRFGIARFARDIGAAGRCAARAFNAARLPLRARASARAGCTTSSG